ncbi:uncharacterized, partial [Tachysurus ichikawai]
HLGAINFLEPLHPPTHSSNTSLLHVTPVPSIIRHAAIAACACGKTLSQGADKSQAELGK